MSKKPKILLFDLETVPNLAYVWAKYQQDVVAFEKEWEILCFAYKWYGRKKIYFRKQKGKDDKSLCVELRKLFDEADMVIAHNANKFDIKKANARFIFHKLSPPSPYAVVDTLAVARKYFKFTSNRLTDLGQYLSLGEKVDTGGFQLWLDCMAGKTKAWKKMEQYNKQDINLLEAIYDELKPWMSNHPNLSLLEGVRNCPICGSDVVTKQGRRATHRGLQQQWKCLDCGGWSSSPVGKKLPNYDG